MNYTYEIYTEDHGETWQFRADGILVTDVSQDLLLDQALEMVTALTELGLHSQVIVRDVDGNIINKVYL